MTRYRRFAGVFALLLALAYVGGISMRAHAQGDCPGGSTSTPCTGGDENDNGGGSGGDPCQGNGGSGSDGGSGGNCVDDGGDETERPRPRPVRTAEPPAPVVVPRTQPRATVRPVTGGTPTNQGGLAATDTQLAAWAKHFKTTPEEVKSWFNPYTTNDTIGGEGSGRSLQAGDDYTISNNGAITDGAAAAGFMDMREGNSVRVSLHSTAVPLGSTTTGGGGRFSLTVKIPPSTKIGRHFVVALAPNLKKGAVAFVYPVNVVTAEPVFNRAVTQPTSSRGSSSPWFVIEIILGTAMIAGLVFFRMRRGLAARP